LLAPNRRSLDFPHHLSMWLKGSPSSVPIRLGDFKFEIKKNKK
jgi:hypothetical protein